MSQLNILLTLDGETAEETQEEERRMITLFYFILHDTGVTMRHEEAIAKRRRYHILDAAYNPPFKL